MGYANVAIACILSIVFLGKAGADWMPPEPLSQEQWMDTPFGKQVAASFSLVLLATLAGVAAGLREKAVEESGSRLHHRFRPYLFELRLVHSPLQHDTCGRNLLATRLRVVPRHAHRFPHQLRLCRLQRIQCPRRGRSTRPAQVSCSGR